MRSWVYFDFKYFKNEIKSMGSKNGWREDIFAGITVACVAIPLALALAMASGVSPGVGLISAIIGGIIAAFFGGTRLAITGPANSMAILIAICVNEYGLGGLLVVGIICGLLQLISGLLRFGRYAKLVPLSVVSAFKAGIGFIIFVGQLPKALQITSPYETKVFYILVHIGHYITTMNPIAFIFAIITIVILKILPRYFPKAPTPLIAVAIPTIIVITFGINGVSQVGSIPHSLAIPKLPDFAAITNWMSLIEIAVEVFLLASLETLLSSSAVDSMGKGDLHNPNQELVGQGLANIGVAMFGGIPVTGVIARSSVNIAAGATTRRSAIIHSLVILGVVYLCPHLVEIIPVPALAGILLAVGMSMMNINELVAYWKSDKSEFLVYIITFFAIITTDLAYGIKMGVFVAFIIVGLKMLTTKVDFRLWANKEVLRIGLSGSMTFWSFDKLDRIKEYVLQHTQVKFVLFDLEGLRGMDQTGASHLLNIVRVIKSSGIQVIIHDLSDEQVKIMNFICPDQKLYVATITESQIKEILEAYGVNHSAEDLLKHGMGKFLMQYAHERKALLNSLAHGQRPHTLLITCSDSRVNPNTFLSAGLGELFIVRNVGNVVPKYNSTDYPYSEGAAIEFALGGLGVRNIVICAHTECGAIKACVDNQPIDSIGLKNWLEIIKDGFSKNKIPQDGYQGVKFNLINQMENLKTYPLVERLLSSGELSIAAWVYDIKTANILEWNQEKGKFEVIKHEIVPLMN